MIGFTEDHLYAVSKLISRRFAQGPGDLSLDVEWYYGGYGCTSKDELYKRLKEQDRQRIEEICIEVLLDLVE